MQGDLALSLLCTRMAGSEGMQQLAEQHLPLVGAMLRRFPACGEEKEDLYQQGCLGLIKAITRYDPASGTAFSTYAAAMILGEMRMLRRQTAPIHIPRPEREARSRLRKAEDMLTAHLGREPTIAELAEVMRMDAAELAMLMEEVQVTSSDAETEGGTPLAERIADPDDWQRRIEIQDMLRALPRADQQLLLLRLRFGLTQAETARRLGMTQIQVSRRERMLKTMLRRMWTDDG